MQFFPYRNQRPPFASASAAALDLSIGDEHLLVDDIDVCKARETKETTGAYELSLGNAVVEDGELWRAAAKEIAMSPGIVRAFAVGRKGDLVDEETSWPEAFAVEAHGAVLIRPDGYVSWRSRTIVTDPLHELSGVLNRILRTG